MKKYAENVSIMHQGRIVEKGATAEIFRSPQQEYTKLLLSAMPAEIPQEPPSGPDIITMDNYEFSILCLMNIKFYKICT